MGTTRSAETTGSMSMSKTGGAPVIQFPQRGPARVAGAGSAGAVNRSTDATRSARPTPLSEKAPQDVTDMEIPTFIRRQMD